MASSSQKGHRHLATPYGTTAAPPPTPSTHHNSISTSESIEALSRLLHRLPPTLSMSLPSRRPSPSSSTSTTVSPPLINLSDPTPTLHSDLLSAAQQGFFQLTHHNIPSQLARSAESNSSSLFSLPHDQKQLLIPKNWPLGYDADDDDGEGTTGESFILDSSCSTESTELKLDDLKEFTREMEKLGLEVIEALAAAVKFGNPVREDPTRVCSLMWISQSSSGNNSKEAAYSGRLYPYIVGLEYQITCQKYSLLADSGWVSVSPQVESVLVTLGDISQVWSNGMLKKVRGRPVQNIGDSNSNSNSNSSSNNNSETIRMSLLITLPIDSTVSPLIPMLPSKVSEEEEVKKNIDYDDNNGDASCNGDWVFNSFSFEDYAWRVYHERLLLKDPLLRYRI